MNAVSLFAGIGGFDLAAQRAGITVTDAVEIDPACRRVLTRRFPATRLHEDIRDFQPPAGTDLVMGGWPCQDLSVAGRRAGLAGARSGLFWEFLRVVAAASPRWVVGENVPGLLSSNRGRDMGAVLGGLAEHGYLGCFRVLDAQHFGVAQRRRRVLVVASAGDSAGPVQVLLEPESSPGDHAPGRAAGTDVAASLTAGVSRAGVNPPGRRHEDDFNLVVSALTANGQGAGGGPDDNTAQAGHLVPVVGALAARYDKGTDSDGNGLITHPLTAEGADASEDGTGRGTPLIAYSWQAGGNNTSMGAFNTDGTTPTLSTTQTLAVGVRRLTPTECEGLQGFPDGWTDSQPDSVRYRQLGNAVAVPVAQWVLTRLVAV